MQGMTKGFYRVGLGRGELRTTIISGCFLLGVSGPAHLCSVVSFSELGAVGWLVGWLVVHLNPQNFGMLHFFE